MTDDRTKEMEEESLARIEDLERELRYLEGFRAGRRRRRAELKHEE